MSEGRGLTRTINTTATEYFLEKIWQDDGNEGLRKALNSLSEHFEYYERISGNSKESHRVIHRKYAELLDSQIKEFVYPDEVDENRKYKEGQVKEIKINSYERNPLARKECIKHFGAFCQICQFTQ